MVKRLAIFFPLIMTAAHFRGVKNVAFSLVLRHPSSFRPQKHQVPSNCPLASRFLTGRLFSSKLDGGTISTVDDSEKYKRARYRAEQAFSILARQGKAWKRLSHIVDMALAYEIRDDDQNAFLAPKPSNTTIVDIGTDHGLLAMGLALTGRFRKVIGVDVSENALQNALSLLEQVTSYSNENTEPFMTSVDFRCGDGLQALGDGEGHVVCIAGMGVNTMIEILNQRSTGLDLDRIHCTQLILQPTNSKPRNLILLYKKLQQDGWTATDESIEKLSSRWYMTIRWQRQKSAWRCTNLNGDGALKLPGTILSSRLETSHPMQQLFDEYCQHHQAWILRDAKFGPIDLLESQWVERFGNHQLNK